MQQILSHNTDGKGDLSLFIQHVFINVEYRDDCFDKVDYMLQVIQQVNSGKVLECPRSCPQEVYKVMLSCWKKHPNERLTMREIHSKLEVMCVKQPLYLEIVE